MTSPQNQRLRGKIISWKIINAQDPALLLIKLSVEDQTVMSLLPFKIYDFLFQVNEGDTLELFGHYNDRKQFVISKYLRLNPSSTNEAPLPAHLTYPNKSY